MRLTIDPIKESPALGSEKAPLELANPVPEKEQLRIALSIHDPTLLQQLKSELTNKRCQPFVVHDLNQYLADSFISPIHLILLDHSHTEEEDSEWLRRIKEYDPLIEVIFIENEFSRERVIKAIKQGAYDYLSRPLDTKALSRSIREIEDNRKLRKKIGQLEDQIEDAVNFHGLIAKSPRMLDIFSTIRRLAKHFTTVLITGETGTGKEMVARALHDLSPRHRKNFVACNCSALVETLLESELFGHVKGAFTGAIKTKHGLFEVANGGTLFLDEIGELSPQTQVKLLRVLENREVKRVGSNETVTVDVRVITATNRNLEKAQAEGRFREDLYYRLNTAEIHLPPLRERREDILLLAKHFLNVMNERMNKKIKGIARQAQIALLNYPWKGNVRELENVIERAALLASKDFVTLGDLPSHLQQYTHPDRPSDSLPSDLKTLEEVEAEHIRCIMKNVNRNKTVAAKILGLSRRSLYRKLDKYNI